MSKLGVLLAGARKRKNLTLRAVERTTGVSNAYLSQLENGNVREPSPIILARLADLYEVPYPTMLEYAGYRVPKPNDSETLSAFSSRIGHVSEEEETALLDYLNFLRSKRGKNRNP